MRREGEERNQAPSVTGDWEGTAIHYGAGSQRGEPEGGEAGSRRVEAAEAEMKRGAFLGFLPCFLQSLVPCPWILGVTTGSLKQIPLSA